MRYLLLTYYTKPNGQVDEAITVTTRIKTRDYQTVNVILDFKEQQVVKASMNSTTVPKNWDAVVSYYYQHYPAIIERLFQENGHVTPDNNKELINGS
jgi:hypothetical protein